MFILRPRLAALILAGLTTPAQAGILYSNDFETNTAGFDTTARAALPTTAAVGPTSTYLGRVNNGSATLTVSGLTAGATYTIGFDLFVGGSWDGNEAPGPDHWRLTADGGPALIDTTFQNNQAAEQSQNQGYSDANPTGPGAFAGQTGADVAYTGGTVYDRYAIYYFGRGAGNPTPVFTAAGATAVLTFEAFGLQGMADEFWGLDNVVVADLPVTLGEQVVSAPAPPAAVLAGVGLATLAGTRLRRRAGR